VTGPVCAAIVANSGCAALTPLEFVPVNRRRSGNWLACGEDGPFCNVMVATALVPVSVTVSRAMKSGVPSKNDLLSSQAKFC